MRYVVVDTETTGFPEEGGRLVEVAAIGRFQDGTPIQHEVLYNPGVPIPAVAMAVHHITDRMVADEPDHSQAHEDLVIATSAGEDTDPIVWVAHNAAFDRKFLPDLPGDWICTYRCALHLFPDAPAHGNQVLRYWLGLDEDGSLVLPEGLHPHRALYDILVTEGILRRLLRRVRETMDAEPHAVPDRAALEELVRLSTAPVVLRKARFGKHAGKEWEWIVRADSGWCDWYLRLDDGDDDVQHTIRTLRQRRAAQQRLI